LAPRRAGATKAGERGTGTMACPRGTVARPSRIPRSGTASQGRACLAIGDTAVVMAPDEPEFPRRTPGSDDHADPSRPDDGRPASTDSAGPRGAHRDPRPAAAAVSGRTDRDGVGG